MNPAAWHQVKLIVERALAQTRSGRRAYIEHACADDWSLRSEVNSLLDQADAGTHGFLETPAVGPEIGRGRDSAWIGQRIDAYRIVRKIGSGGMGEVHLARREEGAGRPSVAVKVMRGDVDSPALRRRFDQEQRLHARLCHPFVTQMVGQGVSDGRPYILLEHVEGQPIDAHCRDRRLTLQQRVQLVVDVCAAIDHVHARSIIHCDIKPANLLVTANGRPKLLDFGIAELLWPDEPVPQSTIAHLEGIAMFTPECAAPEQLKNQALTRATDIYGLGLLLFRLLTGRMPHAAHRSGLTVLRLRAVCENDPMPLSRLLERFGVDDDLGVPGTQDLSRLRRGDMDRVLARALAREPVDRYPSAMAFSEDLRRLSMAAPARPRPRERAEAFRCAAGGARRMPPRR